MLTTLGFRHHLVSLLRRVRAKPAGIVGGMETSLKAATMLDQQLTTACQTGLRHPLHDSDHDSMSDLSGK